MNIFEDGDRRLFSLHALTKMDKNVLESKRFYFGNINSTSVKTYEVRQVENQQPNTTLLQLIDVTAQVSQLDEIYELKMQNLMLEEQIYKDRLQKQQYRLQQNKYEQIIQNIKEMNLELQNHNEKLLGYDNQRGGGMKSQKGERSTYQQRVEILRDDWKIPRLNQPFQGWSARGGSLRKPRQRSQLKLQSKFYGSAEDQRFSHPVNKKFKDISFDDGKDGFHNALNYLKSDQKYTQNQRRRPRSSLKECLQPKLQNRVFTGNSRIQSESAGNSPNVSNIGIRPSNMINSEFNEYSLYIQKLQTIKEIQEIANDKKQISQNAAWHKGNFSSSGDTLASIDIINDHQLVVGEIKYGLNQENQNETRNMKVDLSFLDSTAVAKSITTPSDGFDLEEFEQDKNNHKQEISKVQQENEESVVKIASGPKIMIVDDQEFNVQIISNLLNMAKDYEKDTDFAEAYDGQQALDKVKSYGSENPFQLILMDLTMPILDGYESAKQIQDHCRDSGCKTKPFIIACTAESYSEELFEKITKYGMQDMVSKPVSMPCLIQLCKDHVKEN